MQNQPQEQQRDLSNEYYLGITNRAQIELMKKSPNPMKWVEEEAGNFRKIIKEEPGLLDLYLENPEEFRRVMKEKFKELDDKKTVH